DQGPRLRGAGSSPPISTTPGWRTRDTVRGRVRQRLRSDVGGQSAGLEHSRLHGEVVPWGVVDRLLAPDDAGHISGVIHVAGVPGEGHVLVALAVGAVRGREG